MIIETGALLAALIVGILLSAAVAAWVSWLYRRRMLKLMRVGAPPREDQASPKHAPGLMPQHATVLVDLWANRRARWKLLLALTGLCVVIGVSQA